jgi:glycosyltransferase involved in cell wall biosynthesis
MLEIGLGIWIAAVLAWQLALLVESVRRLRPVRRNLLDDAHAPPALVVLCLRGGDPFLDRTLARLIDQDYPHYRVRIVVDSLHDGAAAAVQAFLALHPAPHVEVQTLARRFSTCTGKLSSLLQATRKLPPEVELVAILDGDTVLHRGWLRELASTIVVQEADVATGNRWYIPEHSSFPNYIRYWWNSSALGLMAWFRIPWGGTTAVRRWVIEHPELRKRLRFAFSDDTTIGQFAREQGAVIQFRPQLVINNAESTSLRGFFNFEIRQLLAVKMQHRAWPWLALHGILATVFIAFPLSRLWVEPAAWIKLLFRCGLAVSLLTPCVQEWLLRRTFRERGESPPRWTIRRLTTATLALAALPVVHLAAIVRATVSQVIQWRGVEYRLQGEPPVQILRDLWLSRELLAAESTLLPTTIAPHAAHESSAAEEPVRHRAAG